MASDESRGTCAIAFGCFDTFNRITVHGAAGVNGGADELLQSVYCDCLELHRLWSFTIPTSDVARVNQRAVRQPVDPRTALLLASMKVFHETEPVFDFTVGPVSYLWKKAQIAPPASVIAEALSHVGADKVSLEGAVVVKEDPRTQIDVGGAAKGFAADSIVGRLKAAGVASAEVDLGGNVFMLGSHPSGRPWRVAVRVPEGMDIERPVVEVCDKAVVTSGGYERFVEIDGKRYQHIVDASTGAPSESDIVSATVVADSSLQADMLSTTALLVGTSGLDALKARHRDAAFIAITASGKVVC